MKLETFLNLVNANESDIINYSGEGAFKAVESNGYALQYVKEQTENICLAALKNNRYAIQYVDKGIFD